MLVALRQGKDPKRKTAKTLRSALSDYLVARKDLRPSSVKNYQFNIDKYLRQWLDLPLQEITREMVEARHLKVGEDYGSATANSVMRTLRALWNWAASRDEELPRNPVQLSRQWFPVRRRERLIRTGAAPGVLRRGSQVLLNKVARDYLLLLLFTGLRRSEAASLTWGDVDLTARVIRVPALRTKAGAASVTGILVDARAIALARSIS